MKEYEYTYSCKICGRKESYTTKEASYISFEMAMNDIKKKEYCFCDRCEKRTPHELHSYEPHPDELLYLSARENIMTNFHNEGVQIKMLGDKMFLLGSVINTAVLEYNMSKHRLKQLSAMKAVKE